MALRFDGANADDLHRTTGTQPSLTTFTEMLWVYLVNDRDTTVIFTYRNNPSDTEFILVGTTADGLTIRIETQGASNSGTLLSTATWYHVCITKDGSAYKLYLNGTLDIDITDATSITNIEDWYIGNVAGFSNSLDGRVAGYKCWSGVALTADEIRTEMRTYRPRRWASLFAWLPMVNPAVSDNANDYSGLAHGYTVAGTLTREDGPPISWGATRQRLVHSEGLRFILGTH